MATEPSPLMSGISVLLNVATSVGLILVNKKLVFAAAGFHFGAALTIIHFIWTFLLMVAAVVLGFVEFKKIPIREVLKISAAFSGYVLFQNLSLVHNSVGFYQVMKIANTPTILLIDFVTRGVRQGPRVLGSLVVVCFGIFIAVFTDSELNVLGVVFALHAVIFNSLYTIWGKTHQDRLDVGPAQLLLWQAPVSAVMLAVPMFLDNFTELREFQFTGTALLGIGVSCVLAGLVNPSFFWMVGQTSPITANVVGYVKTVCVFGGGFVLFSDMLTPQNVVGAIVTVIGTVVFSWAKNSESSQNTTAPEPAPGPSAVVVDPVTAPSTVRS